MKINVKVHPNSSQEKIKKISDNNYEIWVKENPVNGKANLSVIKILKKYFKNKDKNFKEIKIKKGLTSRNKIIDLQ